MKRKTLAVLITATCLLLLAGPVFLAFCGFFLPEQYGDTFLGELKEKYALLKETRGKRIILIGGSGVAFGYDCSILKEYFPDHEVINFGMYAGLGTKVMLDLSVNHIREGDIVILSPEQEEQALSGYFNGEYMWQAADGAFELLGGLKREDRGAMIGNFPRFAMEKLRYVLKGERPQPEGVYRKSSFNEYGDIETEVCAFNVMPDGWDKNTPIRFKEDILEDAFAEDMNAYAKEIQKKGAVIWYRFCPVNEPAVENGEDVEKYYEILQKKIDFPIIGNPKNSIMEAEWFYDTNFHLNSSGKIVNTVQTVRDMKAMLGNAESVSVDLPSLPEREWEQQEDGNNEDEAYFTWKEENAQAVLTGLTEEGAEMEALTIPVLCGGFPVRKLGKDVFAGNENIREITIQKGLEAIEDGAFSGCSSLKAIMIKNESPSDIRPGQKLLEGTDAQIYIDEKVLSDYRLNYFWSVYGERISAAAD